MKNLITLEDIPAYVTLPIQKGSIEEKIFNSLVEELQKYYLLRFLGAIEYKKLIDDLDENGEPQSEQYIDLLFGCTLVSIEYSWTFTGFKEILKYFVISEYLLHNQAKNTTTGSKVVNSQQSISDNSYISNKIVEYYNKAVELVGENETDFFENNLISYFYTNDTYFPALRTKLVKKINVLGL